MSLRKLQQDKANVSWEARQAWQCTSILPTLSQQRQEDPEFKTYLDHKILFQNEGRIEREKGRKKRGRDQEKERRKHQQEVSRLRGDQAVHILPGPVQRQEDAGFSQEGMVGWDHPVEGEVCLEEAAHCPYHWVEIALCAGAGVQGGSPVSTMTSY